MKQSQGLGEGVPLLRPRSAFSLAPPPPKIKDKRQLRNDFHLTAWDKALVAHPPPPSPPTPPHHHHGTPAFLHSRCYHKGKVSEALRGPRERVEKGGGMGRVFITEN